MRGLHLVATDAVKTHAQPGTHRIEPRELPVQSSPQGDAHMALTALFLENAWKVTPRDTDCPGSAASAKAETLPSA